MSDSDNRVWGLKTALSEEEDMILDYLSKKMGIKKSVIARIAIMEWCANQRDQLSNLDEIEKRALEGRETGESDTLNNSLTKIQNSLDALRREINK